MNEIDLVRDISRRFEKAEILYMLTGSMAMNYYAQPRMTRDIDVVIAIGPEDVGRVAALFRPDYYVSEENIRESVAHESIFNLIHQESVIKVDCIIRKRTQYRRVEFERRQRISIRDFNTFLASKEDLIISKLVWAKDSHSEIQLGDVRNLLDTGYDAAFAALDARTEAGYFTGRMSRMTDTPAEIERIMRDKLMARSGEERFVMGAQMFDSACEMVKASLPAGLSEAEQRRQLFKRLYGKEIDVGD